MVINSATRSAIYARAPPRVKSHSRGRRQGTAGRSHAVRVAGGCASGAESRCDSGNCDETRRRVRHKSRASAQGSGECRVTTSAAATASAPATRCIGSFCIGTCVCSRCRLALAAAADTARIRRTARCATTHSQAIVVYRGRQTCSCAGRHGRRAQGETKHAAARDCRSPAATASANTVAPGGESIDHTRKPNRLASRHC